MKRSLMVAGAVATVGLSSLAGVGIASAYSGMHAQSDIAAKIAQKFNLNEGDVQKVLDEDRAAHEAEFEQKRQEQLNQAVKDGTLTQDQANQLTAKEKEMKDLATSLKDKTPEERRSAMKAKMDEFKKWIEDNKIPEAVLKVKMAGGAQGSGRDMKVGGEVRMEHDTIAN